MESSESCGQLLAGVEKMHQIYIFYRSDIFFFFLHKNQQYSSPVKKKKKNTLLELRDIFFTTHPLPIPNMYNHGRKLETDEFYNIHRQFYNALRKIMPMPLRFVKTINRSISFSIFSQVNIYLCWYINCIIYCIDRPTRYFTVHGIDNNYILFCSSVVTVKLHPPQIRRRSVLSFWEQI